MNTPKNFDELYFFAGIKERPNLFLGKKSLTTTKAYIFGMMQAFAICGNNNAFRYLNMFTDWYYKTKLPDKNGYASMWNHILYISAIDDSLAFDNFFKLFEEYLKQEHNLELPEV